MADQAHEWTDEEIERLERRFRRQYNQASREMRKRLDDMMESYDKANAEWKQRVKSGDATQEDYDGWLKGQATDRAFVQSMAQTLAQDANRTNQLAMDTVNDAIPSVFAENANYAAFEVEHGIGYETHAFDLYDQSTVRRLIRDQPDLLPPLPNPRMDNGRDLRWNRQKFASVITQSVLQGESIPKAADRISRVMRMNEAAATRAARTALTGAENAGRIDSYRRAQNIGIELEQEWLATHDERTRITHRLLDGEHVPVGERFVPDGYGDKYSIGFPGDPTALGEMVWNCFIGETLVTTDSQIKASYCHEYVGELITIDTSSGVHFTCTPNHPILTPRGWVAAKSLNYGDNLLVTGRSGVKRSFWKPNVNHAFASMKTVHELFDVLFAKRATVTGVDFHGDIATSDVEIVAKKGFLGFRLDSSIFKRIGKLALKPSDTLDFCEGTTMKRLRRIVVAASSIMSSLGVCAPLVWGHGSHSDVHGLRATTGCNSSVAEYAIDNLPAETMVRSELLGRLSGQVFVDEVVNVKISSTRGTQVYNLQTDSGYYFANERGNGKFIIAKNCRCTLVAWLPSIAKEDNRSWAKMPDGMTYDEWKHNKKAEKERKEASGVVDGKNILGTWQRRESEYEFAIRDVINAQGFDGKPRVVTADEFDAAVKASNGGQGFVAQRVYGAPNQEVLEGYRKELYEGSFFVDCSGGSTYGYGMYTASDFTGTVTSGIRSEMEHYENAGRVRTLKDVDVVRTANRMARDEARQARRSGDRGLSERILSMENSELLERYGLYPKTYTETMTLDPSAKIIDYDTLSERRNGILEEHNAESYIYDLDMGTIAALLGYDAIDATRGRSGHYTVILNRTKLIIRRPE